MVEVDSERYIYKQYLRTAQLPAKPSLGNESKFERVLTAH